MKGESSGKRDLSLRLILLCGLGWYVAHFLGLYLAFPGYNATPLWPASGLALALVIRFGSQALLGIALGSLAANGQYFLSQDLLHPALLTICAGNLLEPAIGAWIFRSLGRPRVHVSVRMALALVLGGMAGALVSALIGVPSSYWAGFTERDLLLSGIAYWWLGNWAGAVVFGSFFLTLIPFPSYRRFRHRLTGFLVLLAAVVGVMWLLFSDALMQQRIYSLSYLILLVLMFGILLRSFTELVWAQWVVAVCAVVGTLAGKGPFMAESLDHSLVLLQVFLIVVPSLSLISAAQTSERRASDRALKRINEHLEARVRERTQALETAMERERELAEALRYRARHDALTGLANRYVFEAELNRMVDQRREGEGGGAIAFLDLDQFKLINDACGHAAGDELLRRLGGMIQQSAGDMVVARLGGDEFGLLMPGRDLNRAHQLVDDVVESIRRFRFDWEGRSFWVGACAGIAAVDAGTASAQAVMSMADAACYAAKGMGRNRIKVYQPGDAEFEQLRRDVEWVEKLSELLDRGALELDCQQIHDLADGRCVGAEILVRLRDEDGKRLSPAEFLPAMERHELGPELDRQVVAQTLERLDRHGQALQRLELVTINLSGQSLTDESFLQFLLASLRSTDLPLSRLCFEITETAAIARLSAARHFIESVGELGCRFALDDFGSGLSSFGYLRVLPVQFLKIDGQFIRELEAGSVDHGIVQAIQRLAESLRMVTIAEFVESNEVLSLLKAMGVNHAQGYLLHRPQPLEDVLEERENSARNAS